MGISDMKKGVIMFGFLGLFIGITFLSNLALTKKYWSIIIIMFVLLLFTTFYYIKNKKYKFEDMLLSNQLRKHFEKRDKKIRRNLKFSLKKGSREGLVILGKDQRYEDKHQYTDSIESKKEEGKGLFNMFD
mgnify:CR=1 FL=1